MTNPSQTVLLMIDGFPVEKHVDMWELEEDFLGDSPARWVPRVKGYRILDGLDGSRIGVKE